MKFRRKVTEDPLDDDLVADLDDADEPAVADPGGGPYDADELDSTEGRVDLGALLLLPVEGTELQLQVDEASGNVQSVMFTGPEGALELKVFAAPRNGDLWSEVRPRSRPTSATEAARPPSGTAGSAPSWSARCR